MSESAVSPNPVESPALAPTQIHSKVGAQAAAASLAVVLLWGVGLTGIVIPLEVGAAVTGLIGFAAGYLAKS